MFTVVLIIFVLVAFPTILFVLNNSKKEFAEASTRSDFALELEGSPRLMHTHSDIYVNELANNVYFASNTYTIVVFGILFVLLVVTGFIQLDKHIWER